MRDEYHRPNALLVEEDNMPAKKASPSRSGRGTNPPGGGYGRGGKKKNPLKPKPGRKK
jgi:hypothetical protein